MRVLTAMGLMGLGLAICGPARAAAPVAADPIVLDQVTTTWSVAKDGTSVADSDISFGAPPNNPSRVVRFPLTWSGSQESMTVLQARVDRADGTQSVLTADAMREAPPTGDQYFHEFSDQRRLLITFPDVGPNDTLVVRTRRAMLHPRVPGAFSASMVLDSSVVWKDVTDTINVPVKLPFQIDTRGFDHQSETIIEHVAHYLKFDRTTPVQRRPGMLSQFDRQPGFAASTFANWDQFAKAYAPVLLSHITLTRALRVKANSLVGGQLNPREQARLLYEWVRDNVRYIPVPLEDSRPEPNDADDVLKKLYGDCKDHVVLYLALLSARDIPAEIVLLNDTNAAAIPGPPGVFPMNHLLVYLPGLDIYADTTLAAAPFGALPFPDLGKPAIYIGGTGHALGAVPMPLASENTTEMTTNVTMAPDGSISGDTTTIANGAFGVWLRRAAVSIGADNDNLSAASGLLFRRGTPGTGQFFFDPPGSSAGAFTIHGTFALNAKSTTPEGGFFALWTGLRILPRPGDMLAGPLDFDDPKALEPTFCYPGKQRETLTLTLPAGREMGTLPPDGVIDSAQVHYQSHWSKEGRKITVVRSFESLVPGPVCAGIARRQMADIMTKVRADLNNLVGLRVTKIEAVPAMPDDASGND